MWRTRNIDSIRCHLNKQWKMCWCQFGVGDTQLDWHKYRDYSNPLSLNAIHLENGHFSSSHSHIFMPKPNWFPFQLCCYDMILYVKKTNWATAQSYQETIVNTWSAHETWEMKRWKNTLLELTVGRINQIKLNLHARR